MKVVVASTEEQVNKLNELIHYIYHSAFPRYFTDQQIAGYIDWKVLHFPEEKEHPLYTLDVAFRAIASLEVIISILDVLPEQKKSSEHQELFKKNVDNLSQSGLFFPFTYQNFLQPKETSFKDTCSMYAKPANQFLI
ncbi:hypothetical protein J14TS2_42960 [Bacillus sp. J14TS2]|uniref:DUF5365 family protein n=1 Tax=unclassified Bacillus (in: firmicutes) TaxID=185979 RepID=UPI001A96D7E7|nr:MULTISPECIES: DUF5365 family protein [unclassified Bacillus (in: firmicutes)]MBO0993588.1 DUF5365 family protein [Bacillus sp. SD088]GIN73821.1 hypothetical protein J14TS2_42960 [Bacillus sp. J14TS2]